MIILITLGMICFVAYAWWIIDVISKKFNLESMSLFVSLILIIMPPAILIQTLIYLEVLK